MKKRILLVLASVALGLTLVGCGGSTTSKSNLEEGKEIRIGVTPGPHAQIWEDVQKRAEKEGVKIKIIEFSDYIQPNIALSQGEIDINSMQHLPYLENMIADRGLKLAPVGSTILMPMAIYSGKSAITDLSQLLDGASVGIPNDPTNEGRALLILEQAGLIKLKDPTNLKATPKDIVENPKNLKFIELEAAQVPQSLKDLDIAVINSNYAIQLGFNPQKDSLLVEGSDSPYANLIVVQDKDKENLMVKKIIAIYQTQETKDFIEKTFKGSVISAF